jgi:hypothetical protein
MLVNILVVAAFWFLGGLLGHLWMKHMITGFPSKRAVEVLALIWGLAVAVCARALIVELSMNLVLTIITYCVGCVVSGPTRKEQSEAVAGATYELRMQHDYVYYKREVLSNIPLTVYIAASAALYFLWK